MKDDAMSPKWPDGVKKTKPRQLILAILEQSDRPLTVMDIHSQIRREDESVWLSTIYRTLDVFIEKQIVVKTVLMDDGLALYELNCKGHRHYAVCIRCHKMVPLETCPMEAFIPKLQENHFRVTGHKLEMYGYCAKCHSE